MTKACLIKACLITVQIRCCEGLCAAHPCTHKKNCAQRAGLSTAEELPGVVDVRVLGAIGVIEMAHDVDMAATTAAAMRNGVWLRPFGRLIYAMPPFISTDDEVAQIARAMVAAAESA